MVSYGGPRQGPPIPVLMLTTTVVINTVEPTHRKRKCSWWFPGRAGHRGDLKVERDRRAFPDGTLPTGGGLAVGRRGGGGRHGRVGVHRARHRYRTLRGHRRRVLRRRRPGRRRALGGGGLGERGSLVVRGLGRRHARRRGEVERPSHARSGLGRAGLWRRLRRLRLRQHVQWPRRRRYHRRRYHPPRRLLEWRPPRRRHWLTPRRRLTPGRRLCRCRGLRVRVRDRLHHGTPPVCGRARRRAGRRDLQHLVRGEAG